MKLQALRWSSVAAVLLAAPVIWAQTPPVPRTAPRQVPTLPPSTPPGSPGAMPPGAGPGSTPAETPPGAQPNPPQSFDQIAKVVESPYRPKPLGTRVKFNLQDADLSELVNHISGMTGKRFIYGPKVRQIKATVVSPEPVTLAEAYEAFLSILEANGMTVIPHGQFLKIVDSAGVATASTPIIARGAPVPDTDRFVTRLYRLRNTGADEVAGLLAKFKSKDGDISTYAPGQLLIITDTGTQVQRMIRIVEEVDVGGAGAKMWIEPVHYGSAQDLSQRVNELFDLGKGDSASGLTKVVPDQQSNSLIVVGTQESYLRLLELLKRLDNQPTRDGNVHVLQLQNSVAEELANTLNQMLQGAAKSSGPGTDPKQATRGVFEGDVKVTADKATNSLVITSSGHDYAALRAVIDDLDRRRRQVFIEAVIMSLMVNNTTNLGMKYHGGGLEKTLGKDDSLIFGGLAPGGSILPPNPTEMMQGLALGVRGPEIKGASSLLGVGISVPAFGVMLTALAKSGQANVLATPHILATDNTEATINVGENIPLQENFGGAMPNLGALGGQTGATAGMAGMGMMGGMMGGMGFNAQRQDVGTKIKVTPHINEKNQVRLEIDQEISERGSSSGTLGVVSITKRNISTTLIVDDQQTVVIGGLMRDEASKSRDKIPVLGDLPVLGFLFRSSKKEIRKTNLLLVITPYVVNDQTDLRRIFERKMQERQEFLDRYFVFNGDDWKAPKDYARTNGLVEDIRHSYFELEERDRLDEESQPKPELTHDARDSIDLPMDVKAGPVGAPGAPPPAPGPANPARPRRRTRGAAPGGAPVPAPPPTGRLDSPFGNTRLARNVNVESAEQ